MNLRKTLTALVAGIAIASAAACAATRTQRTAGETIDDTVILSSVKAELMRDSSTSAHEINVEVYRGKVQLNGYVDSEREKSAATTVASRVKGVQSVQNNLAIGEKETVGEYLDDATVTAKVKAALIESRDTKAYQINVETEDGVVQLSGFVDTEAARSAATTVARAVKGVKDVRNELSVKTS